MEDVSQPSHRQEQLPIVKSTCPNDGFTKRQDTKELLASIYQTYPFAKKNFLTSLSNQEQIKLWVKGEEWEKSNK